MPADSISYGQSGKVSLLVQGRGRNEEATQFVPNGYRDPFLTLADWSCGGSLLEGLFTLVPDLRSSFSRPVHS